jgi:hypothetical protein
MYASLCSFMHYGKRNENLKENESIEKNHCQGRALTFTTAKFHSHLIYLVHLNPKAFLVQ